MSRCGSMGKISIRSSCIVSLFSGYRNKDIGAMGVRAHYSWNTKEGGWVGVEGGREGEKRGRGRGAGGGRR